MHPAIAEKREALAALCRRYGVTRLEVFGSAARGHDFDPAKSDADFLVAFEKEAGLSALDQFFGFAEALEEILGRPVDLVERGALEASRNYIRRRNILADAEVVYG
jgi:predicted nucleotidyltransferase